MNQSQMSRLDVASWLFSHETPAKTGRSYALEAALAVGLPLAIRLLAKSNFASTGIMMGGLASGLLITGHQWRRIQSLHRAKAENNGPTDNLHRQVEQLGGEGVESQQRIAVLAEQLASLRDQLIEKEAALEHLHDSQTVNESEIGRFNLEKRDLQDQVANQVRQIEKLELALGELTGSALKVELELDNASLLAKIEKLTRKTTQTVDRPDQTGPRAESTDLEDLIAELTQ